MRDQLALDAKECPRISESHPHSPATSAISWPSIRFFPAREMATDSRELSRMLAGSRAGPGLGPGLGPELGPELGPGAGAGAGAGESMRASTRCLPNDVVDVLSTVNKLALLHAPLSLENRTTCGFPHHHYPSADARTIVYPN